jgi:DNA-binding NarL/FixJ family response regulator
LELVGEAGRCSEAIKLFQARQPDVTLVDLTLPDGNGVDLIAALRSMSPSAHFLVLTANTSGGEIGSALRAGAQAYLFKNSSPSELLTAIRAVAHGGRYLSSAVGRKADAIEKSPTLTAREVEALRWIVRGHSNLQIATEMDVTEDTVKFHVRNILGKFGVDSRSKAVAMALKLGLVRPE